MKYLLACFVLLPLNCLCQRATISASKMNVLYIGVPNPVSFTVQDTRCSLLKLVVENGKAEKTGDCEYDVLVEKPGITVLSLVKGRDTMYKTKYRVKFLPTPTTEYSNEPWPILLDSLRSRTAIQAITEYFDFDATYSIVSYEVSVFSFKRISAATKLYCDRCVEKIEKNGYSFVFLGQNAGVKFNDTVKEYFLKELKVGDKVFIENIQVRAPDGKIRRLNSIKFNVQ